MALLGQRVFNILKEAASPLAISQQHCRMQERQDAHVQGSCVVSLLSVTNIVRLQERQTRKRAKADLSGEELVVLTNAPHWNMVYSMDQLNPQRQWKSRKAV